jgi:hypothetical protein
MPEIFGEAVSPEELDKNHARLTGLIPLVIQVFGGVR